jgi:hypothetical protein
MPPSLLLGHLLDLYITHLFHRDFDLSRSLRLKLAL